MYNVSYFKEEDADIVKAFIQQHPFAVLCGSDAGNSPVATHIPVLIEERGDKLFLLGHIMRKTDHHKAFEYNPEALVIFSGAHTYVSASWYTNPQTASTWNYMAVHAKGKIRFLDNEKLYDILARTTAHFENNPHSPALVEKMPEDCVSNMSKAIIAFEIEVIQLDNVFKLSQNRDTTSHDSIIGHLKQSHVPDAIAIATEMAKRAERK